MFRFRRHVYLDNNATTQVSRQVRRRMASVLKRCYGNPSSLYRAARNSAMAMEEARECVARAVGAEPSEILFTGSASEANNMAIKGAAEIFRAKRRRIVSTPIEHASVMSTLQYLEANGVDVRFCPVDSFGRLDLAALKNLVDDSTFLVCAMLANNEIGTLQDVASVTDIAHARGALCLSDCVQALGKVPVNVRDLAVDYAVFSAHKIHGPKGVGALYSRAGSPLVPFIHGGHQENGLRAGTESIHNIAGFGEACSSVETLLLKAPEVESLRDRLADGLRAIRPNSVFHSLRDGGLPNTISVTLPGVSNAVFMAMLDAAGIAVSAGSACDTQADEPSHVLTAIGLSPEEARQTIRVSLSTETTRKDVEHFLRTVDDHFSGRTAPIEMVTPAQVDEDFLLRESTYILDVRFWHDRKLLKGLPNSHEIPFLTFNRYLRFVPRDKRVLVVCQNGYNSPIVAYALRKRGCRNVGFLFAGLLGWWAARKDLYSRLAGKNVTRLGQNDCK